MRLVKVDNYTFINVEKIVCLRECSPDTTYIYVEGNNKEIHVDGSLYKIKKIIEDAMKEK